MNLPAVTPRRRFAVIHHRHAIWVPALAEAEPRLEVRGWHPRRMEDADWEWLAAAEGLFTWTPPPGLLPRMPRLAWIQNAGAGVDHLVGHPELPPTIVLTRADGRFGLWMARYVLGHLLREAQCLEACAKAQAEARWASALQPEDLGGRVAVVLGYGRIGRCIGRALDAIGMEIHGIVRHPRADPEAPLHGFEALARLLPTARLLVICAPLTPETRGILGPDLLELPCPDLTLVNIGRGAHVDLDALRGALDTGRLRRAVLDVFPEEPLPSGHWIWTHPRVTLTPHHAGPSTPADLIPDIRENLARFAEGRPILNGVDRDRGY